jgi:hypothetical protein
MFLSSARMVADMLCDGHITLNAINAVFEYTGFSLADIVRLLFEGGYADHPLTRSFVPQILEVINTFLTLGKPDSFSLDLISQLIAITTELYKDEIKTLTDKAHGWHFNALRISTKQLCSFELKQMGIQMQHLTPHLWILMGSLIPVRNEEQEEPFEADQDEIWVHFKPSLSNSGDLLGKEQQNHSINTIVCYFLCFCIT